MKKQSKHRKYLGPLKENLERSLDKAISLENSKKFLRTFKSFMTRKKGK